MWQMLGELIGWTKSVTVGNTNTQEALAEDVDELIDRHATTTVTDELFDFGKMLLANNEDRVSAIDTKAMSIVGFSSAILAFLVTRAIDWDTSTVGLLFILAVGTLAALACLSAGLALRGAQNWKALGEATWFPPADVLDKPDELKRFYIKAMHQAHQENHRIANRKASQMILGQLFMGVGGILLAVALGARAISALRRPTVPLSVRCPAYFVDSLSGHAAQYSRSLEDLRHQSSWLYPIDRSAPGHLALVGQSVRRSFRRNLHP
jgi:hypothetical protein